MDKDKAIAKLHKKLYVVNKFGYKHQNPDAVLDADDIEFLREQWNITTEYDFDKNGTPSPVHASCLKCQTRHYLQYKDYLDSNGKAIERFPVQCNFIRGALPKGTNALVKEISTKKGLPEEEVKKIVRTHYDPVAWNELFLGFDDKTIGTDEELYLRWYQKEQIRCTAKKMVIRWGRRTGKSFAISNKLLNLAFTQEYYDGVNTDTGETLMRGPIIFIATPFQNQLTTIFNEIESLIKKSSSLTEMVKSGSGGSIYTRTPQFRIELADSVEERNGKKIRKKGARIFGSVAGVVSKGDSTEGGSMRGGSPDIVYLDEMDMIAQEVLDKVILPFELTNKHVRFIATSTPIGSKKKFYEWSTNRPDWKPDYLPSTISPNWEAIESSIIAETTEEGFNQEYMANFLSGSYGVFRNDYILDAMSDYEYKDVLAPGTNWFETTANIIDRSVCTTVIGIDWNVNAGTEFVVITYDPNEQKWWVLDAVNILPGKWTSETFKRELIRLNFKWKPDYIYADHGWGHTIIEDLQLEGSRCASLQRPTPEETATARLATNLIAFNFSKNVEMRNPATGDYITKPGKQFLVDNAVRVFETHSVFFPSTDITLRKQLENYKVIKYNSQTQAPVYGMENDRIGDHRLDAFMLALGGLTLEEGRYAPQRTTNPNNFGMVSQTELYSRAEASGVELPGKTRSILEQLRNYSKDHNIHLHAYNDNEEINSIVRRNREAREKLEHLNEITKRRSDLYPDEESPYESLMRTATPDQRGRDIDQWEYLHLQALEKRMHEARSQQRGRGKVKRNFG